MYKLKTREAFRVNHQTLSDWYALNNNSSKCSLYRPVHEYLLQQSACLRLTHHLKERLQGYVHKMSRCNTYIEMYPSEYSYLQTVGTWFSTMIKEGTYCLVQLGWNAQKEICKIGLVTRLPLGVTGRWLFLCIGADMGIKTMYITPEYKHRDTYCEQGNITVVTMDHFRADCLT
jgi:hypothetical protein